MKNEVVTLVTTMGEFVGEWASSDEDTITLSRPCMFMMNEQGAGFTQQAGLTGAEAPKELSFFKSQVITYSKTNERAKHAYQQAVTGLILPGK